jgi:XTP/dITP diphosphohydrolase
MTTLLIATRNAHKVQEISQILSTNFGYLTLRDFPDAPPVIEDADTFEGNARKKAVELARWVAANHGLRPPVVGGGDLHILADDSGLEVDALSGEPGVRSARFASGPGGSSGNSPDAANNAKLLRLLEKIPMENRTARFRCVLALTPAAKVQGGDFSTVIVNGVCEGRIAFSPSGTGGFGYDPLFIPNGYDLSFAELGSDIKNKLSHRARALENLRQILKM